jgi:hypothetical protein
MSLRKTCVANFPHLSEALEQRALRFKSCKCEALRCEARFAQLPQLLEDESLLCERRKLRAARRPDWRARCVRVHARVA